MDLLWDFAWLLMPFVWWPVALVGAWSLYKRRSLSVTLITIGSAINAALGSLNRLFGYKAVFDSEGNLVAETPGLLSPDTGLSWLVFGTLCLVLGLVLLLWTMVAKKPDA
jgi:hypothetical protein